MLDLAENNIIQNSQAPYSVHVNSHVESSPEGFIADWACRLNLPVCGRFDLLDRCCGCMGHVHRLLGHLLLKFMVCQMAPQGSGICEPKLIEKLNNKTGMNKNR